MLPTVNNIVVDIFTQLDYLLKNYVQHGYSAVVDVMKVPLGIAITLYCGILLYNWHLGTNDLSTKAVVTSILKICFLYSLAMNWDFFSGYFVALVNGCADDVGKALVNAAPVHMPTTSGEGITGSLQMVLSVFMQFAQVCFKSGSIHNPMPAFEGLIVYIVGGALTLVAVIELVVAKVFLSLLFAMAPLFATLALFKPTQGMFDNWIKEISGYALMMIFVAAVIGFVYTLLELVLPVEAISKLTSINAGSSIIASILGGLSILLLIQAGKQGKALGGGFVSSSGSAMMGAMVGGVIGSSMKGVGMAPGMIRAGKNAVDAIRAPSQIGKLVGEKIAKRLEGNKSESLKDDIRQGE